MLESLFRWFDSWLVYWLVGWLVGSLVGWLVGWRAGWLVSQLWRFSHHNMGLIECKLYQSSTNNYIYAFASIYVNVGFRVYVPPIYSSVVVLN